ncbi:hypothetical protein WICMUC_003783 [Wickerhamomyces mucosus]|uniref:Aldehyde dehydrogenase n=1 Tax=Wickerhamomyces mucosus TaxID=1378264 RepID=A0A9P8TBE6_9ASCO|nr:hypothetical protein WICMUC_003783 [Wickerhamomyces mucosus]
MSEELQYTDIKSIPSTIDNLKVTFHSGKTQSLSWRLDQLRNLYFALKDNEDEIKTALQLDLNKSDGETAIFELNVVYGDLLYVIENLSKWVKPTPVTDVSPLVKLSQPKIHHQPLGTVLIISAFNYPLTLSLQPLIGAIAGGNTVTLKLSESTSYTSDAITQIIHQYLDNESIAVINGGVEETTVLLQEKFDKILYTGNGTVGKIIAKKAAETLTPVILELGGKSPSFITENTDVKNLKIITKRLLLGKFINAGQTCIAPDYLLVHESKYDETLQNLLENVKLLYGDSNFRNYSKIIHERSFERLNNIINNSHGTIIFSGENAADKRFLHPTIIKDVTFEDSTMKEELFGPILPIIKYSNLNDIIDEVIIHHDTPLALYIFSNSSEDHNLISTRIRSGSIVFNETLLQAGIAQLPFGGIGSSGYGDYHGKSSFYAFTSQRASLNQPLWVEPFFEVKYPPISDFKLRVASFFAVPSPKFGRTGPVVPAFNITKIFKHTLFIVAFLGVYFGYNHDGATIVDIFIQRVENVIKAALGADVY